MGKFTTIARDAFDTIQLDAGVILTNFDPANPVAPDSDDILATTTGGINIVCKPTYSDLAEDVDNALNGLKEYMHLDSWECSFGFTSIKFNGANTKWALGSADVTEGTGFTKVVPRRDLSQEDFGDIWWVGDKANGGAYAVKLMNAISSEGLSIKTTKNGKGQSEQTISGHPSAQNPDVVPMEFYDIEPDDAGTFRVAQNLTNVTSSFSGTTVDSGASLTATLTPASGYTLGTVTVTMNGIDITEEAYSAGTVTISSVTANVVITATGVEVETHTITQTLTNVTSSLSDTTIADGETLEATLTADDTYTLGTVTVEMGSEDITSTAWDSGESKVTIASVTDDVVITATAS